MEITAEQARKITGRCLYHGVDLHLVGYIDGGLESVLDAWTCSALGSDPDLVALFGKRRELDDAHPAPWDQKPAEVRDLLTEMNQLHRKIWERCEKSWVLTVPE